MAIADEDDDIVRLQFRKTRLCSFHMKGCCQRGTECGFAHDFAQVKTAPDLTKTSLCAKWKEGQCNNAASTCKFAHGKHDLRKTPQFLRHHGDKKKAGMTNEKAAGKDKGQIGAVAAPNGWLGVDHGFGLLEEHVGMSLSTRVSPAPGIPSPWMSEPMKVIVTESFDNKIEVSFTDRSIPFPEKLMRKYTYDWEGDTTTDGCNSDARSSRSQSPSSFAISPRKVHASSAMMDNHFTMPGYSPFWESPWDFTNAEWAGHAVI